MELRKDRIFQDPIQLNLNGMDELPWANLDVREFNKNWAYKPVLLYGEFFHPKEKLVKRIKEGEDGFEIITPFYCYLNSKGEKCALLVDRGWVHVDIADDDKHKASHSGPMILRGMLFKGDSSNKYSEENYMLMKQYNTVKPRELALAMNLNNIDQSSQAIVKLVEYDDQLKSLIPTVFTPKDLFKWTIAPETHQFYSHMWFGVTFLNIFSNMLLWIYL